MRRFYTLPATLLLLLVATMATSIVACGDDTTSDEKDTTVVSADTTAKTEPASTAEIDRIVADYTVAADSLATLFDQLKSVEDVEKSEAKIRQWSGVIRNFQAQSARHGQPLIDRMSAPDVDATWQRLVASRERLQKNPDVYTRVAQIEDGTAAAQ